MEDITLDTPVDDTLQLTRLFLNRNIRNALQQLLRPPTAILTRSTSQTTAVYPNWTAISWDTVVADTENPATPIYSAGNPTRLTSQTPGWYEITAGATVNIQAPGSFLIGFRVNGSTIYAGDAIGASDASTARLLAPTFTTPIRLPNVGDYVEVIVKSSYTSSPPDIGVNWNTPRVAFRRVRGL